MKVNNVPLKKEGTTMQRNTSKHTLAAKFCALLLAMLLFLAGCGNYSSPGGAPQTTPTSGGYNIIHFLDKEMHLFLAPHKR